MTSFLYDSMLADQVQARIDFTSDDFYVLLAGPLYSGSRRHERRSDIVGEVTGTGYAQGGKPIEVSVAETANRIEITLGGATWHSSTIDATGGVYYRRSGDAPEDDELIAYIDFNKMTSSKNGKFSLSSSLIVLKTVENCKDQ